MKRTNLMVRISLVFLLGLGLAAVGLAGPRGKPTEAAPAKPAIAIENFSFSPQTITVPVGATVTWTNRDEEPHTVVSNDEKFRSHPLDTGDKFSFTFSHTGIYAYFCSIHPRMVGKVVVR